MAENAFLRKCDFQVLAEKYVLRFFAGKWVFRLMRENTFWFWQIRSLFRFGEKMRFRVMTEKNTFSGRRENELFMFWQKNAFSDSGRKHTFFEFLWKYVIFWFGWDNLFSSLGGKICFLENKLSDFRGKTSFSSFGGNSNF